MFWSKNKKRVVNYRELATDIRGTASDIINTFAFCGTSATELKLLHQLVGYMDTFLVKCLDNNELTNKHWITARLIEVDLILSISKNKGIQALLTKVKSLQYLIMAGEIKNDDKRNKDSGSD